MPPSSLIGHFVKVHSHYDPSQKPRKIEKVRTSPNYPGKLIFNVQGIQGGIISDYVTIEENTLTSPQRQLLAEFDFLKLSKKAGINKEPPMKEFPQRSGNLETPDPNPRRRKFMGQQTYGSQSSKPGRESSEKTVHAKPTSMDDPTDLEELGHYHELDISDDNDGEHDEYYPRAKSNKPIRLQGPAEDPGNQSYTSMGNRYPGIKSGSIFP